MNELFANPIWAYVGIASISGFALLWPWAEKRRKQALSQFAELDLVEPMLPADAARLRFWRFTLRAAAVVLLFIAAAGPRWGVEIIPGEEFGVHVVLAVDTSGSMAAEDVKPSRMEKTKRELASLIDTLAGNRVGIVAFSGMAAIQCPLTTDLNAARMFLTAMHTDMLPIKGTHIGDAVRLASKMLAPYPGTKGIVLFTDGEDHGSDPIGAAKEAANVGVRIFTLGIGNPDGEPIPLLDSNGKVAGYKRDDKNQIVLSKMDERTLSEMANLSGGAYYRATASEAEMGEIASQLNTLDRSRMASGIRERLRDRTQVPLTLALVLILLELALPIFSSPDGRGTAEGGGVGESETEETPTPSAENPASTSPVGRGNMLGMILILGTLCVSSSPLHAASVDSHLRQGSNSLDQKDYDTALDHFTKAKEQAPDDARAVYDEGIALYRLGKFKEATESFHKAAEATTSPMLKRAAIYNEGDAHFRAEQSKDAVSDYRRLLEEQPGETVTKHNLQVALKRQQQQQQQNKEDKSKDQKDQKKDQSKSNPKSNPQGGMKKEDAERILQSQQEKEKNQADPNQYNRAGKMGKPGTPSPTEDW